ncbi:TonB-dependent siderophore receptor [Pseudoduganella namucuonensis]|uniref:Outer-membrane receptor for ferric coprogen and ferric-rhodotorulic acid n=1 Tax=Pseudoduganella namucuonensis TaxID=1035707 RepID=A0A1I7EY78_9BURK|nr:TonB-dependent siderophore receptor [Pseudoduganella namucuonensis]SFU28845.1 outer-membrane receptor for ferric coprogen and ferric-rhodotorulic acid [Pseudoduganella namucuonensis]
MPKLRLHPFALAAALLCGAALAAEEPAAPDAGVMPTVVVKGEAADGYTVRKTASSAPLDLSLRDTPQAVSVVTRAQMDDFQLNSISDVLQQGTGVTVEKIETDRTYYTARGFDVTNFQYDGVGVPFVFGNVGGEIDTALYERIDIVRGANGLMSGTGNPSATVNFIRKRPTGMLQASAAATIGSWDKRRVQADISGALNESGTVSGRVVAVRQEGDSHLDRYSAERDVVYGVVEARFAPGGTLTVGHASQTNKTRGGLWGALPLYYTDGGATDYDTGTSTSTTWARNKTGDKRSFAELEHQFGDGWRARATLSRNTAEQRGKLFYVYGTPDRATGLGLYAYPSLYDSDNKQTLFNASAGGPFSLGGRQHEVSFGGAWSKSTIQDISHYGQGIGTPLPSLRDWTGAYPEPAWDAYTDGSAYEDKRKSAFAAARFNLSDGVKLIAGINRTKADSAGTAYGASQFKSASKSTPYAGLVYDLGRDVALYGSYTEIFNPQSETDAAGQTLRPMHGKNAEVGVKAAWFEQRLNAAASVFKTRQRNTAEQAGMTGAKAYYRGVDAESQGVELDLSGELARGLQASAGFTVLSIEDAAGQAVKTYLPRRTLRLSATYQALPQLKVGANANWQDDIHRDEGGGTVIRQDAYATLGLMAQYELGKQVSLAVHLNNVTDKKYLTSLYWSQGYYAAPRNASATLSWKY